MQLQNDFEFISENEAMLMFTVENVKHWVLTDVDVILGILQWYKLPCEEVTRC